MNQRIQKVINHPLHQYLGVRSINTKEGAGTFSIEVSRNVLNPAGAFHGGVIYFLCDVCAYAGLLSLLDDKTEAVTHDIQVSVMSSAKLKDIVEFNSKIIRLGRRLCFIEVTAMVKDKIIATAKITKSIL
ncbi:MAG: PaaI family thioesterase [Proteobacteria bacterium]|nr:PaaI family thioesterase [Pseudomonadota bacterium]MBU1386265.1 PaaI family thioesterase [Pseudomonadota bacterium]MBU1542958.1 PaaI family thioesterase [Pseudomonadota bacterium]MBU2431311.1 PaaI family thioesterase [Pseudomonadota bacterium]MBU2479980.1 PaaI family thioesterase [Pseudomonadota bacterium]